MAIQPLQASPAVYATATGTATFTFPQVANSQVWTGTLNCPTAPDTGVFTMLVGATSVGQFKGANAWGPIQLGGGDQLIITAVGLVPGVQYQMSMIGNAFTVESPTITYPVAYADTVTSSTEQIVLGKGSFVFADTQAQFTVYLQPAYRSVYVIVNTLFSIQPQDAVITAFGNVSGISYNYFVPPYFNELPTAANLANAILFRFPIVNGLDTALLITITHSNSFWISSSYVYGADLANVDTAIYSEVAPANYTELQTQWGGLPVVNLFYASGGVYNKLPLTIDGTIAISGGSIVVTGTVTVNGAVTVSNTNATALFIRPTTTAEYASTTQPQFISHMVSSPTYANGFGLAQLLPTYQVPVGGSTHANVTITALVGAQILAANSLTAYRLHSISAFGGTAGTVFQLVGNTTGYVYGTVSLNGTTLLNGLLIATANEAIYVKPSIVTAAAVVTLHYDTIPSPYIGT